MQRKSIKPLIFDFFSFDLFLFLFFISFFYLLQALYKAELTAHSLDKGIR